MCVGLQSKAECSYLVAVDALNDGLFLPLQLQVAPATTVAALMWSMLNSQWISQYVQLTAIVFVVDMLESIAAMEPTVYERALNLELVLSVGLHHRTILRLATTLACWKKWVRSYSRYVC